MLDMLLSCVTEDYYIIQVGCTALFTALEDLIHESLERC